MNLITILRRLHITDFITVCCAPVLRPLDPDYYDPLPCHMAAGVLVHIFVNIWNWKNRLSLHNFTTIGRPYHLPSPYITNVLSPYTGSSNRDIAVDRSDLQRQYHPRSSCSKEEILQCYWGKSTNRSDVQSKKDPPIGGNAPIVAIYGDSSIRLLGDMCQSQRYADGLAPSYWGERSNRIIFRTQYNPPIGGFVPITTIYRRISTLLLG